MRNMSNAMAHFVRGHDLMKSVLRTSLIIMATAILAACGGEGEPGNSQVKPDPVANRAPVIAGVPATSVSVGVQYSFTPTASDPDGNALTFSAANLPGWATFDAATGAVRGTPAAANIGTFSNVAISVSDGSMSASLPPFTVQVQAAAPSNRAPTISGTPPNSATVGAQYSFAPTASDPDGNTLTFTATNVPAWLIFNRNTGTLSGTPASGNVGTAANISISVSDGTLAASLAPFSIQITAPAPANRAPTISGTPPTTATAGVAYSFTPTASDPDGNTLVFSAIGLPSWLSLNVSTGRLSGTPSAGNVGTAANIRITVSDGTLTASLAAFSIQVAAAPTNNSATVSWVAPAQRVDGSALTNLSGFKVYVGQTSRNYTQVITVAGSTSASSTVTGLGAGIWFFAVAAYDATGVTSDPSTEVSKTF